MPDFDLWWLESRKWAQTIQKTTNKAREAAETLFHAREGNAVEKGLAFMTLAGMAAESIIPPVYAETRLQESGWHRVSNHNLSSEVIKSFLNEAQASERVPLDSAWRAEDASIWENMAATWRDEEGKPQIILLNLHRDVTIWERVQGTVSKLVQTSFWNQFQLVTANGLDYDYEGEANVTFSPMRSSGDYVGDMTVQRVREAFTTHEDQGCRVVLLVGPTGVGKTTLSCTALGASTTVLKLPKPTKLNIHPTMELLRVLQPEVVLLDDIPLPKGQMSHTLAQLLDDLHDIAKLVVCTFMDDTIVSEKQLKPGVFYYPGMRSGRVDEIIFLGPPDEAQRVEILEYYGLEENLAEAVAVETEGLTGAFLKEVADRILTRNQDPMDAVRIIRLQAPPALSGLPPDEPLPDGGGEDGGLPPFPPSLRNLIK